MPSCSTSPTGAEPPTRCATCASNGAATTRPPTASDAELPVFPTVARRWNDPGLDRLYQALRPRLVAAQSPRAGRARVARGRRGDPSRRGELIPPARGRYLAEIAEAVRGFHARSERQAERAADAWGLGRTLRLLGDPPPSGARAFAGATPDGRRQRPRCAPATTRRSPISSPSCAARSRSGRTRERATAARRRATRCAVARSASRITRRRSPRTSLPKVALPRSESWGELTRYLRRENLPGQLPVHRRRVSVQARERGPGAHVRRRGDARAHQPALPPAVRRAAGRAALDRLRQPDALRPRSRTRASTSGARSATPACRSARSTTPRSSTRASTCAIRRRPSR